MDRYEQQAQEILTDLETHGTRRCLICANINPCSEHSWSAQQAELARNDAEIAQIRGTKHG